MRAYSPMLLPSLSLRRAYSRLLNVSVSSECAGERGEVERESRKDEGPPPLIVPSSSEPPLSGWPRQAMPETAAQKSACSELGGRSSAASDVCRLRLRLLLLALPPAVPEPPEPLPLLLVMRTQRRMTHDCLRTPARDTGGTRDASGHARRPFDE